MKFVERPEHKVAAENGCDGQNHMKRYHDNRLGLRQTVAFKTNFRGNVHLCFVVATFPSVTGHLLLGLLNLVVVATFPSVTGHLLLGLLNLELQLPMCPFKFLIRSQLLLSEFKLACAQLRFAEY